MINWNLIKLNTVDSTNLELKRIMSEDPGFCMPENGGIALLAASQTAGRGRLQRSFCSPDGMGMYLSVALAPKCSPEELFPITCWAGIAVLDAIENLTGVRPSLKWPNDIVYEGKKLGGILTELELNPDGSLKAVIIGIGVNVLQNETDFPEEIRGIAGSVKSMLQNKTDFPEEIRCITDSENVVFNRYDSINIPKTHQIAGLRPDRPCPSVEALADEVLRTMGQVLADFPIKSGEMLSKYKSDCVTLGKPVNVITPGLGSPEIDQIAIKSRKGNVIGINSDFSLLVKFDGGSVENVSFGDVSIRET